jgi:hypothetical protein
MCISEFTAWSHNKDPEYWLRQNNGIQSEKTRKQVSVLCSFREINKKDMVEHVARMGGGGGSSGAYGVLVGNPGERGHFEDLDRSGRMLLKYIFKE